MLTKFILIVAFAAVSISIVAAAPQKEGKAPKTNACKDHVAGGACDPEDVNCDQCDWCEDKVSKYFRCQVHIPDNPYDEPTGKWVLEQCPPGYLVDPTKKLASGLDGGQCTAWDDLDAGTKEDYLNMPECKVNPNDRDICKYGQQPGDQCSPRYWFQASLTSGQEANLCNGDLIWDVENENCAPCTSVTACLFICPH